MFPRRAVAAGGWQGAFSRWLAGGEYLSNPEAGEYEWMTTEKCLQVSLKASVRRALKTSIMFAGSPNR